MAYLRVFYSCLFFILIFSCTYQPEEEFYKKIAKDDAKYSINLNEFLTKDTLTLYGPAEFNYSVVSTKGKINRVEIQLNNDLLSSFQDAHGTFRINYYDLQTGFYELKVVVKATSGSGSLADHDGLETVEVWKKWVVYIDKDYPPTPVIKTEMANGMVKVSWTSYAKESFLQYRLEIDPAVGEPIIRLITDPNSTSWMDSSFVAGNATGYHLQIQNKVGWSSEAVAYASSDIGFKASFNPRDSLVTVQWNATKYTGTFKSYTISEGEVERLVITEPGTNFATFKPNEIGVNYTTYVRLTISSKNVQYNGNTSTNYAILEQVHGEKMRRRPEELVYNLDIGKFFGHGAAFNKYWIYEYDDKFNATDSASFGIKAYSIPFRGQYAYYSEKPNVVQLNLNTFEHRDLVAISSPSGFASGPGAIDGATVPIVAYAFFGPNPVGSGIEYYGKIYDYENNVFRFSKAKVGQSVQPKISVDGKFMRLPDNTFYKYDGTSYVLVGSLTDVNFLFFRPDAPDEIVAGKGANPILYVYDANTLSLKRTINPLSGYFTNYDPVTKLAIFGSNISDKNLKAVNMDTGTQIIIKAGSGASYKMLNGILFTNDGYYIKLF